MRKYREIPAERGLYWSFKDGRAAPEPLVYFRQRDGEEGAQVVKSFDGGNRRFLYEGEYLLGPVEPPIVDGEFTVIEHSPSLLS